MSTSAETREVQFVVPADADLLRLCRLSASAAGAVAGFDVDELEDVRVAVGEALTVVMVDGAGEGTVRLVLRIQPGRLEVEGVREHPDFAPIDEPELTAAILGATVDEHAFELGPGRRWFRLYKRSGP